MQQFAELKGQHFFTKKDGGQPVWQWSNIPLWGWIVIKILGLLFSPGRMQNGFDQLSTAFLFTWAYLEITQGISYFRRLLGLAVMIAVIMSFFK